MTRKTGVFLQVVGGLMCALTGMGASAIFDRYVNDIMTGERSDLSMDDVIATGLEYALLAILFTGVGAFLLVYGGRVARRATEAVEGPQR